MIELEGERYEMIMTSDPSEDAMVLELWAARPGDLDLATGDMVLRIVRYDETGNMELSAYQESLPVTLVDTFIAAAKKALPPKVGSDGR